ncbi:MULTISPECIES: phage head closure protein [Lactobacillus]|uniref:Phage head closure protein n=1 Tax=Lactobacillus gasseri TaxID=1596 RepID=A0A8A4V3G6_LACGS|nr:MULTISPECIES: phage head closure protein [Lactobacillus]MBW8452212.1 phage head closure protein [Lactobacillus paragasseri]QTD67092.1 phage head closure protein [Lactobacillus gasseri]
MQQQKKRISKIADIGELDRRITLMKKKYVGENPNTGMSMYKDVRLGDVWAKVSALHGQEYYTAVSVKLEKQLSFIIRYRDDVDEETNIWFEGRGYNIGFIDDVKYNHEYLEIKAEYSRGVDNPDEDN